RQQRGNERTGRLVVETRRQQRRQPGARGLLRQLVHGILLPPVELALVEVRRRPPEACRVEGARHVRQAQESGRGARVTEAVQVIEQRERLVAALAVLAHAHGTVAL